MVKFRYGLDLSNEIVDHHTIQSLEEATDDPVILSDLSGHQMRFLISMVRL